MKKAVKQLWLEALESGEYKRVRGQLVKKNQPERYGNYAEEGHCCLGVLAELAVKAGVVPDFIAGAGLPEDRILDWAGLSDSKASVLAGVNDGAHKRDDNDTLIASSTDYDCVIPYIKSLATTD